MNVFKHFLIFIVLIVIINLKGFSNRNYSGTKKILDKKGRIKSTIEYKNGKKHGWSTMYFYIQFENPVRTERFLLEKSHYMNDKKNGWSYSVQFPNSNALYIRDEIITYYVNGLKHGWSFSRVAGGESVALHNKELYQKGKLIGKFYKKIFFCRNLVREINPGFHLEDGTTIEDNGHSVANVFDILRQPETYKKQKWPEPFFGYFEEDYYHFDNLIDGIKETVWVSAKNTDNAYNHFILEKKNNKFVKYLVIVNGNRTNNRLYYDFSRLKKVSLTVYLLKENNSLEEIVLSKKNIILSFNDNFQIIRIPLFTNKWISVSMLSYENYPGKKYKNLAVSDFYFEY